MAAIDEVLSANRRYAKDFNLGNLPSPPARRLAVLSCMDARLDIENILGLAPGDAHIIRNAGGIASQDALRSLVISHHLLGTQEIMIINHTSCGLLSFTDEELNAQLAHTTGVKPDKPVAFYAFTSLDENVRAQVAKVRGHPWIPPQVSVRGFVYAVQTGRLREVV